jgi:hypothetical protein
MPKLAELTNEATAAISLEPLTSEASAERNWEYVLVRYCDPVDPIVLESKVAPEEFVV